MTGAAAAARRAFVSLGSNLGDRAGRLAAAREALAALPGTSLVAASRVYETAPQDLTDQPSFLNQVVCLDTALEPLPLLRACQAIEDAAGRVRGLRFGPRTLDVDILLVEGVERDDPELTLPHPRLWQRAFVLVPLAEVWTYARGMPEFDVAAGAARLAPEQGVALYQAAEDE
jgi:2-amino-4-hydroxy-6-hydroxymethyldihydropteridine diphosphokinase